MMQLLAKLRDSIQTNPREIWLIFNNFQYAGMFDSDEHFNFDRQYIYADAVFDVFRYQPTAAQGTSATADVLK